MTTTPKALPETREYKMHPDRCRVACSRESCTCAPNRFDWEARPLVDRLSDEADQCRNDGAGDIAKLLDEAVQALNAAKPADHLASAGGVEVVAYMLDREGHAPVLTFDKSRFLARDEFEDLVRQSDHLAALSKALEVADGLRAELEAVKRDAERYRWLRNRAKSWYIGPSYSTYNDAVVEGEYKDLSGGGVALDSEIDAAMDAALTAHRGSRSEG